MDSVYFIYYFRLMSFICIGHISHQVLIHPINLLVSDILTEASLMDREKRWCWLFLGLMLVEKSSLIHLLSTNIYCMSTICWTLSSYCYRAVGLVGGWQQTKQFCLVCDYILPGGRKTNIKWINKYMRNTRCKGLHTQKISLPSTHACEFTWHKDLCRCN